MPDRLDGGARRPPGIGAGPHGAREALSAAPPPSRPRAEAWAAAAAACLFVARGLAFWDFVPLWDGRLYADCVLAGQLNCCGHPTAGHLAVLSLSQLVWPGRYGGILLVDLLLGAAALLAFHGILRRLDPAPEHAAARVLAVAALSTHPAVLAAAVNLTPDYGAMVFFVLVVRALLARRFALAAIFGIALAFSKEPGIGLYAVAVLANELLLLRGRERPDEEPRAALTRRALLVIPAAPVGAFFLLRVRGGGLWGGETPGNLLTAVLTPSLDFVQRGYVFWIVAAQFQWVLLAVVTAAALLSLRRWGRGGRPPRPEAVFIGGLFLGCGYILTRYVTFTNPRYFLAMAPLLVAAAYLACVALPWRRPAAVATLAAAAALFAVSSIRTADPLTRAVYGTFPFGRRELLRVTSRTSECCGFGRDQLVYNLEFTELHALMNRAYAAIRPGPATVVLAAPDADFQLSSPLDGSFARSLRGAPLRLRTFGDLRAMPEMPDALYYLAFPNVDNRPSLVALRAFYDVKGVLRVQDRGYALDVYALQRL